ncbi:hypothetical protein [Sphingobacterium sp. UME9]|uniref:hypothetical protein n=1 Tax=Sphingobacterium sp. UME9 TaxID=1862316 RepID=UPI00160200CB|nr:hypothetical protein [Sphingobacterium sp. UME9]MBB1643616.1 hypothetical protein [Sphingobacterium sp. UME9]
MKNLDLTQLKVTITQVSVANKKLTKSIFNQIEYDDCFDQEMNFIGDPIYGYVKGTDSRYLLWTIDGRLRRTRLRKYYNLKSDIEYASIEDTEWFLRKVGLAYEIDDSHRVHRLSVSIEDHKTYTELVDNAKEFLNGLIDKQIYL